MIKSETTNFECDEYLTNDNYTKCEDNSTENPLINDTTRIIQ